MRRLLIAIVLLTALPLAAQGKQRWRLNFKEKMEHPDMFVYDDPSGKGAIYWYYYFELENPYTNLTIPLVADVQLYIESDKEMMADVKKVDLELAAEESKLYEQKSTQGYEKFKYGRFYNCVYSPEVEVDIIARLAKILNRDRITQEESCIDLKKGNMYLNLSELHRKRFIQPKEKITVVAIFTDVDPRARLLELQFSGLVDPLKINAASENEIDAEYENQVLKLAFELPGDETNRALDKPEFSGRRWAVKKLGPASPKSALDTFVSTLTEELRRDKDFKEKGKSQEEINSMREIEGMTYLDLTTMVKAFQYQVDMDFGYDFEKGFGENEAAIWKVHEWWLTNKNKLEYDSARNIFVINEPEPKKPEEPKKDSNEGNK